MFLCSSRPHVSAAALNDARQIATDEAVRAAVKKGDAALGKRCCYRRPSLVLCAAAIGAKRESFNALLVRTSPEREPRFTEQPAGAFLRPLALEVTADAVVALTFS